MNTLEASSFSENDICQKLSLGILSEPLCLLWKALCPSLNAFSSLTFRGSSEDTGLSPPPSGIGGISVLQFFSCFHHVGELLEQALCLIQLEPCLKGQAPHVSLMLMLVSACRQCSNDAHLISLRSLNSFRIQAAKVLTLNWALRGGDTLALPLPPRTPGKASQ